MPSEHEQSAERAIAAGDIEAAVRLLQQAAADNPDDPALWLKLAALKRGTGQLPAAIEAVERALAITPLEFTALLMRASLLQRINPGEAGEAWSHAIAQKPSGSLPAQLAAALEEGERHHANWVAAREQAMRAAMATAENAASDDERRRIDRFRSNVLRRTRHYHSEPTHFHYPELVEREFHPRRLFPWLIELEGMTATLVAEYQAVIAAERAELEPYIQYADHQPLAQWRALNRSPDWTAIHLLRNGDRMEANARHCPSTMALLEHLPQPRISGAGPNAMFSLLAPHTAIPAHVGVNNSRLVCHLPLVVPDGCWFRVGGETRHWQSGTAFVFDDTIEHEAMNPSDDLRVVFIFDLWHPDLAAVERDAIAALIAANGGEAAL